MHINITLWVGDMDFVVGEGVYVCFACAPVEGGLPVRFGVGEPCVGDAVAAVGEGVVVCRGTEGGEFKEGTE